MEVVESNSQDVFEREFYVTNCVTNNVINCVNYTPNQYSTDGKSK